MGTISTASSDQIIADGDTAPTDAPADMQRAVAGRLSVPAALAIAAESWERCAYYGTTIMFTIYQETALGRSKPQTVATNRAVELVSFFMPILGAVVADQWLGRFKAILLFGAIYPIGLAMLTISSAQFSHDGGFAVPGFFVSTFVFLAVGAGGIKGNISSFMAEQIRPGYSATKAPGVYRSGEATVERGFRIYYWGICLGTFVGTAICPQIAKRQSHTLAFAVTLGFFAMACAFFLLGTARYARTRPQGTVLAKTWRCMRYAWRRRHSGQAHWLDGALDAAGQEWDNEFVLGLQRSLRACRVFLFYPAYWVVDYNVADTYINQGLTMRRPDWLSADQLNLAYTLSLVVAIPVSDYAFPLLRRMGLRLGPITRITIGFGIVACAVAYAAVLQRVIYSRGPYYDFSGPDVPAGATNNISIWLQVVQYSLTGLSEVFVSITGLEYAFTQAPAELRSVLTALNLATICGGTLGGIILSPLSKDPSVMYVFAGEAAAMAALALAFYLCFRRHDDNDG
ncbi:hypothetical protein H4R18_003669 [Coemansia javaensis]|uniref:Uncharacterized protein n=1 Tax=Coemansia javaensis TaxID=2761396 RepID=A0A9W8LI22_9FUNG|nr:hypothetical protein H4R18_003669 [Coemansia javaensis]